MRRVHDRGFDDADDDRDQDTLPRHIDPLQTNLHGRRNAPRAPATARPASPTRCAPAST
jgi:hypothetical protein